MTKLRPALSFENALTKVAGLIGWPAAAAIIGKSTRLVRRWSDPDATAKISLDRALRLDVAFRLAGGDGAPFLECYALRVEADTYGAPTKALLDAAAIAVKESGEAFAATITAALPGATQADVAIAERELEQSIGAQTNTLAALRNGRRGDVSTSGEGNN
jgi:hypothetical protein